MRRTHLLAATALLLSAGAPAARAQTGAVPVAQRPAPDGAAPPRHTPADVHFMTGMIGHHAQAVVMAGWAPSHGAGASVRILCERIVVGQRDEIATMQAWLRERHEAVPEEGAAGLAMAGMDHPMLMPGMLTPAQLAELDAARGTDFDRLFLRFMIQHHQGALTMVDQLLAAGGASLDDAVFKFAADVSADQSTEIERMSRMLAALPPGGRSP